jgi:hypothetical protein
MRPLPIQKLTELVSKLGAASLGVQTRALEKVSELCCDDDADLVAAGAIPPLVQLLGAGSSTKMQLGPSLHWCNRSPDRPRGQPLECGRNRHFRCSSCTDDRALQMMTTTKTMMMVTMCAGMRQQSWGASVEILRMRSSSLSVEVALRTTANAENFTGAAYEYV